jgi:hypothetical protein
MRTAGGFSGVGTVLTPESGRIVSRILRRGGCGCEDSDGTFVAGSDSYT